MFLRARSRSVLTSDRNGLAGAFEVSGMEFSRALKSGRTRRRFGAKRTSACVAPERPAERPVPAIAGRDPPRPPPAPRRGRGALLRRRISHGIRPRLRARGGLRVLADLRNLIVSPAFSAEDKARGLAAIAERAAFAPTTRKFLGLLAANRRTGVLPSIIDAFHRLAALRRGVVSARVTTAVALTDAQIASLTAALRSALGKDPQIETHVDPSILGGVKVRVGSRLYDASLKSKLDSLKFALKRA